MPASSRRLSATGPVHWSTSPQWLLAPHRLCDGGAPLNWYRRAAEQGLANRRPDQPASRQEAEGRRDTDAYLTGASPGLPAGYTARLPQGMDEMLSVETKDLQHPNCVLRRRAVWVLGNGGQALHR